MQSWVLVTPASRGIGFELARRLLDTTNVSVVATARRDLDHAKHSILRRTQGVQEDRLKMLKVDVLDEATIAEAASQVKELFPTQDHCLRLSLCLPGILFPEKSPSQLDYQDALRTFQTNTLGPMMLLKHFSPFLPRKSTKLSSEEGLPQHAVWANMSARVGSIGDNRLGGWYSYRASKAAVNQITKTFDNHLRTSAGDNAIAIGLHPGTVKTDFSKQFWANVTKEKLFSPEYAAEKLLQVINSRTSEQRGLCWDWKGEEVPP